VATKDSAVLENNMKRGKFIVLEGGDGAGKTSQLKKLKETYGDQLITTREPGGSPFAEKIRNLAISDDAKDADGKTFFALFWAARRDHVLNTIIPALESGKHVICDRFDSSTYAYQIGAQEASDLEGLFWQMRKTYLGETIPDLYVYLQVDPAIGLARKQNQKDEILNHLDAQELGFYELMQTGFKHFFANSGTASEIIDANQSFDQVHDSLCKILNNIID
jgi:dTMP kinase